MSDEKYPWINDKYKFTATREELWAGEDPKLDPNLEQRAETVKRNLSLSDLEYLVRLKQISPDRPDVAFQEEKVEATIETSPGVNEKPKD